MKPLSPFGILVEEERPVAELRELARRHHLVVLRGGPTFASPDELAAFCARFGEISVWPFGKVLELVEQQNPADHIFDSNYVPLHWDGMYRPQVPEFQIFQCVSAPGGDEGGRTTFSHTPRALERASARTRAAWGKVTGVYRRKMEYYDSRTIAPVVTSHPTKGFPIIRYNEPPRADDTSFINHPELEFHGAGADFHESLREALYSPECFYAHAWRTGDIVISDNYTLLHGRESFTSGAPRHLRRVHVLGQPALDNPHLVSHK